ncbi:MAG: ABC transporter permease [Gammaproteobacteria bacterium]|nr:ABC transporter permease [Gammaproteobacteria bacterium]NIR85002.1 ABC transporter permease [Gammaproteobacteria bacterium]NIR88269.1 ABC transporter permease [Gammaproteobacteria bacterium]NIU06049.1 ABC transporter permease [Gammaproteobacteria bacterium]NIV73468.1 ABC transporter permease subunit [Gammaproteobacteria bacterium]
MRPGNAIAAAYVLAAFVFIFLPVVMLVEYSFQDGLVPVPPFRGFTLRWYEEMLGNRRIVEALWHSVAVALVSSLVATVLGFLAAYALARSRPRFAAGIQYLLMAPITVSYLIIGMGLLITFQSLGVGKSLAAVGIGHGVINLPLAFAVLYSQMGEHQANVERAAHDLGASDVQALVLVTVPMLWPALLAAFLLCATLSWDEFIIAFLLSRFDVTLPVVIWNMLRSGLSPELNAVGTFVFAISVLLVVAVELAILWRLKK